MAPPASGSRLADRLHGVGATIFGQMTALARETEAINLGQGFPDTDGPAAMLEQAVAAVRGGRNQYPPARGVPELRTAVADHQREEYGVDLDPDTQVLVTTGATEGIAAAMLALVNPGDEVVMTEPYFDSYVAGIAMAGGVRRPVTLRAPDFRLDVAALREAVTDRTAVLLLNTPHNPTGTVLNREELQAVADVAVEHDLLVVTDEVYEHLAYDGREHLPLCRLPGMADRTVTVSSAGKSFACTGWKIGWVTGHPDHVTAVATAKQFLTFATGAPLQPAVAYALAEEREHLQRQRADLERKRDLLCDGLQAAGLETYRPQGTYFAISDITGLGWADGVEFCLTLPQRAGVVAVPAQVFYDDVESGRNLVRWAFCKREQVLTEALRRLSAADLTGPGA